MLTAGTEGTMYEIASEMFDDYVLVYQHNFDLYNEHPRQDEIRDEMDVIIGRMIEEAGDAMYECARRHRDEFLEMLRRN